MIWPRLIFILSPGLVLWGLFIQPSVRGPRQSPAPFPIYYQAAALQR